MDWDNLYRESKFCLKEPAEEVMLLLPLFKERGVRRILDLGFGAGRHVIYLARQGFELYGTDISGRGKQITEEWLAEESLSAKLSLSDMVEISYPDNFFDACVCRGVITHNTAQGIINCLDEVFRSLAPSGIVMCTFISRESSEYQKGDEFELNTFIPLEGIEEGVPHHFMDEAEVRLFTARFKEINLYHVKHEGLIDVGTPYVSAHWVFVGEK